MLKNCLAIETTGRHLGLAVERFDAASRRTKTLRAAFSEEPFRQSDLLIPRTAVLLKKCRLKKSDIDVMAVDIGPGSFTGVRVGVAGARALAQALGVPLVGVNSLEALAEGTTARSGDVVLCRRPALAGEAYFAVYQRMRETWRVLKAPAWTKESVVEETFAALTHKKVTVVTGDPHPVPIARVAIRRFIAGSSRSFHYERAEPLYLQPSWAERSKRL